MKLKLLLISFLFQLGFAQHRTCGMQEQLQQVMNNPEKKQEYIQRHAKLEIELQKLSTNRGVNNVIVIPVAVHFPAAGGASSAVKTCLRSLAQTQINILNADYNAQNSEISNWTNDAPYYPMVTSVGNLNVQFVLATQNHPAGTGLAEGAVAVTFGTDFLSDTATDVTWAGYLNFVIRILPKGQLGFTANLGCSPAKGDCVTITTTAFGSGVGCTGFVPKSPFDLGRSLTHELGHYFSLEHPFAGGCNATNCSTMGDMICDTPAIANPSYDCPATGSVVGCVNGEYALTMNYMDYANDACMYMFTKEQETKMRAWYTTIASEFKTNVLANEQFLQNNFSVYPNPSKGSFTIEFKELTDSYSVEVFDLTGKTIYENNYAQSSDLMQEINLKNIVNGVYFMNIKSDKGITTKKLIVQ